MSNSLPLSLSPALPSVQEPPNRQGERRDRGMGKSRKLRSSMKALHETLTGFMPAAGAPACILPAETHSFREILTSFNTMYYAAPPTTSPSSASFSDSSSLHGLLRCSHGLPSTDEMRPVCKVSGGEEEAVSMSATGTSTSTCSSCLSSSSVAAAAGGPADTGVDPEADAFPRGISCSDRFFFSPCTSKSIMGGSFLKVGTRERGVEALLCQPPLSEPRVTGEEEEGSVADLSMERGFAIERTAASVVSALCRESIPMAMASSDPYRDFRSSMEEMVEVHGLRGWPELQELLRCYLRLNEEKTHRFIVLAFVDILMHL